MKCGKRRNGKQSTCCGGAATLEMSVAHVTEECPAKVSPRPKSTTWRVPKYWQWTSCNRPKWANGEESVATNIMLPWDRGVVEGVERRRDVTPRLREHAPLTQNDYWSQIVLGLLSSKPRTRGWSEWKQRWLSGESSMDQEGATLQGILIVHTEVVKNCTEKEQEYQNLNTLRKNEFDIQAKKSLVLLAKEKCSSPITQCISNICD